MLNNNVLFIIKIKDASDFLRLSMPRILNLGL